MAGQHAAVLWRQASDSSNVLTPNGWSDFRARMAAALDQEAANLLNMMQDMRNEFVATIQMHSVNSGKGLSAKDLKPDKFSSNDKSKQSYRQWADDVATWLKMAVPKAMMLTKVVNEMSEWNVLICNAEAVKRGIEAHKLDEVKEELLMVLKKFTEGEARTIVDTCDDGAEAWHRLNARYFAKTVMGATMIQSKLMNLKRPTSINESGAMLVEVRRLLMELSRQSQGEKVTSATIKAAYERVLPENYARLLPMHLDPDNVDPAALEEKVTALIRQNASGVAGMDVGALGHRGDSDEQQGGRGRLPDLGDLRDGYCGDSEPEYHEG